MSLLGRFRSLVSLLAALVLAGAMGTMGAPQAEARAGKGDGRLHPYLQHLPANSGDEFVTVIVSKRPGADEQAIEHASGGKHLRSWPFINAMHLRVPISALQGLANHPGVRMVSPDAPVRSTATYDVVQVASSYQATMDLSSFWGYGYLGQNIGIAVLDSGIASHHDLHPSVQNVIIQSGVSLSDGLGHGTHVAGIIAGDAAAGDRVGVAPKANLINVKISDDQGNATESDLISGLEWVHNNHAQQNIRVVNIAMQSTVATDYRNSPLDAAVEQVWLDGVVVVVSAGNGGTNQDATWYPPANDPYVITVGAMDDNGTATLADDLIASWSSTGTTQDGFTKPELLAPGRRIVSTLAANSYMAQTMPERIVDQNYLRLSGSSMAAPMISGAVALMLSYQPSLTPDQVKYVLTHSPSASLQGQATGGAVVPDMNQVYESLANPGQIPSANQGLTLSSYVDPASGETTFTNIYYTNIYYTNIYYTNIYYTNLYELD